MNGGGDDIERYLEKVNEVNEDRDGDLPADLKPLLKASKNLYECVEEAYDNSLRFAYEEHQSLMEEHGVEEEDIVTEEIFEDEVIG